MITETDTLRLPPQKQAALPVAKVPLWYKGGVIYEVHVRAFQDSDGDGTGDFRGLTSRLDYLRDLGITAIWLLPFYPSPLKDDGYDIADYCNIHPMYGTLADFKFFLREAHRRGLRVITELVLNHTSDQHPWFQRARLAAVGSKWREFYVWNDSANKYRDARIIFKDSESSNWTWDARAGAFYWHRFFSHQPDLNFDNPAVHAEMIKVLDFWFDLGVDGVRLDAVPYLYEREGSSCENLAETHAYLKLLRKHVDEKYGDRMLLAEANQWPDDAVAYFGSGKGDECHMAFHFPLMPRLFMSLRMEDRVPIIDILEQTPAIPETSQWALFLRNHDELTLEMVTDEERDYMYRMYAHDRLARLNLGIRRRLAPLVGNDRKRIELLTALLFSLPGTPVLYYGDEIGMGENIYLGDRNGVRTPMQWSADKNAGFSRANPQSLYLPINLDPENHYEAVNVEVQERNNYSLLWWMRRLIVLYKRCPALGRGSIEFLHPENRKIFVCLRRYQNEVILVVANLSRFVQPVEIDLAGFKSLVPIELFGRTEFPPIAETPYPLTLGPHSFYWFTLESKVPKETKGVPVSPEARTLLEVAETWMEIFDDGHRLQLESALESWLPSRSWFDSQERTIKSVWVRDTIPLSRPLPDSLAAAKAKVAVIIMVQVEYVQAEPQTYIVPVACALDKSAEKISDTAAAMVVARLIFPQTGQTGVIYDAMTDKEFCQRLFEMIWDQKTVVGKNGQIEASHNAEFEKNLRESVGSEAVGIKLEEGNSAIVLGEKFNLKWIRKRELGMSPDLETLQCLTALNGSFAPVLAGALEYRLGREEPSTVAILTTYVPKAKRAWDYTIDALEKFYERVQTLASGQNQPSIPIANIPRVAEADMPDQVKTLLDTYVESARQLGQRTAEMHLALASVSDNGAFAPEPFTPHAQRGLFQSLRNLTRQTFLQLNRRQKALPPEMLPLAQKVVALEPEVLKKFRGIYERPLNALRIRQHGDYHLGKVLYTGKEFYIVDFDGEPAISISERRLKKSPLQDVASMIQSFHHAALVALSKHIQRGAPVDGKTQHLLAWAQFWARWTSGIFYQAYLQGVGKAGLLPTAAADLEMMTEIFILRKTIYDLGYELQHRPDWVKISLQGILEIMNQPGVGNLPNKSRMD